MRRLLYLTLVSGVLGSSGYYVSTNWQLDGLENVSVTKVEQPDDEDPDAPAKPPKPDPLVDPPSGRPTPIGPIAIASFHLDGFDARKLRDDDVVARLVEVIRKFDVVAVQDIRSQTEGVLVDLTAKINVLGPRYNFVAPEHVALRATTSYCAFLFNETTVQVDRNTVFCVDGLGDGPNQRPLVASFICQQPTTAAAFTFTLVNVHLDAERFEDQIDLLADLFRTVRNSSGGEDDVILLGNLGGCEGDFGPLAKLPGMISMVTDQPTTSRNSLPVDNLFLSSRATSEFTGRGGVENLTADSTATSIISTHFPVWAEFSPFEGGRSVPTGTAGKIMPRM